MAAPGGKGRPVSLTSPLVGGAERSDEKDLRPRRLEDFVGQEKIKANLRVFIQAAAARGEALEPVLHSSRTLPPSTLGGATARAGMVSSPLRNRFGVTIRLEFYAPAELARIL